MKISFYQVSDKICFLKSRAARAFQVIWFLHSKNPPCEYLIHIDDDNFTRNFGIERNNDNTITGLFPIENPIFFNRCIKELPIEKRNMFQQGWNNRIILGDEINFILDITATHELE